MGFAAYPAQADLTSFATNAGVTLNATDAGTAVAAGIAAFERATRRKFLAGAPATRYYPPPPPGVRYLDLRADLASLTSVTYQPEGATGEVLTLDTDYWPVPLNAAADGEPYTGIEFGRGFGDPEGAGMHRALRVLGTWGYGATIPNDAWQMMVIAGFLTLLPSFGLVLSGGLVSTTVAGVARVYSNDPAGGLRRAWDAQYAAAVGRYTRVSL